MKWKFSSFFMILVILLLFSIIAVIAYCSFKHKNNHIDISFYEPMNKIKNTDNEQNCIYISSRGFAKSCDIREQNLMSSCENMNEVFETLPDVNANTVVYICNTALKQNYKKMLNNINTQIILISGDSDDTIDANSFNNDENELIEFIESVKIKKWYCQNCIYDHQKLHRLPIGLDYHSQQDITEPITPFQQEHILKEIVQKSVPFYNRQILCYSNFHFQIGRHIDRKDAVDKIPKELVFYENGRTERNVTYENQCKYAFVISPHGNGLDCHRTWEALILGCIPIVKTSGLDKLYDDLPVLIVKDWSNVNKYLLEKTIYDFKNKSFNYEKLTLKYWVDEFRKLKI